MIHDDFSIDDTISLQHLDLKSFLFNIVLYIEGRNISEEVNNIAIFLFYFDLYDSCLQKGMFTNISITRQKNRLYFPCLNSFFVRYFFIVK